MFNNEEFNGKINGKGSNLQIPNDYYLIPDFPICYAFDSCSTDFD